MTARIGRRGALGAGLGALAAGPVWAQGGRAQGERTLRFVPQSDLPGFDPVANTSTAIRNHAYLVFDNLYGLDAAYRPQPQMVGAEQVEDGGRLWRLKLREGLRFHDGAPVLARDVAASVRRWMARDSFGGTMAERLESLEAVGDDVVTFRFKVPFPLLAHALGKTTSNMCCVMPQRQAETDPFTPVREPIGSGPFRLDLSGFNPGAQIVYRRFELYRPRSEGKTEYTSGPKVAHFDRVIWQIMPDPQSALGALQRGEIDWWERPAPDLLPILRRDKGVTVALKEREGLVPVMRLNCIQPPFDNPAVRRVALRAIVQADVMTAIAGDDRELWHDGFGVFTPGTPYASDAGMAELARRPDDAALRQQLKEAGYRGERTALLVGVDSPIFNAAGQVVADTLKRIGMTVDLQAMDTATMLQRRVSKAPVDRGGWSAFFITSSGADLLDPASSYAVRGNGERAWYGWPTSPALERMHDEWFVTSEPAQRVALARQMQLQVWQDVPSIPLGQILLPTAFRRDITGVVDGFPKFYGARRA